MNVRVQNIGDELSTGEQKEENRPGVAEAWEDRAMTFCKDTNTLEIAKGEERTAVRLVSGTTTVYEELDDPGAGVIVVHKAVDVSDENKLCSFKIASNVPEWNEIYVDQLCQAVSTAVVDL